MPFLVTLGEMRPLVRSLGAVQRVRFIGDEDLNPWIVGAHERLYDLYILSGDPYFEKETDRTIQVGTSIAVPADLYVLRRVDFLVGDRPVPLNDLDVYQVAEATAALPIAGRALGYRLRGQEIQLPHSAPGQSYRITYAPKPTEPRDQAGTYLDDQAFDVVDLKGRDWVILRAAIRVLDKQREDTSNLSREADILRQEILIKANKRTVTRLKRIADTASQSFEDPYLSRRWWRSWVPWR